MKIAENIKFYRKSLGLTQEKLANLLSSKKSLISNYENQYSTPDIYTLIKLADIFNITLERAKELLQGTVEKAQGQVLGKDDKGNEIVLNSGRYGPYIKCGKNNYAIPKELKGKEITLEDALKIIKAKG